MNSRAVPKMCWNAEETGMPNDACRTGFSFAAKAGQQQKNCTQHSSGIGRTQKPRTRRLPFVFTRLHAWNCPPAVPAVCSVAMRKDALCSLSNHGALSFTAPLRSVLFHLSSVAFRLTTSIALHCVLFCSATFRFADRLGAGVLCFRVSDTPKQAHLPSLDPAAPFRYSSRHSIRLHSSRQPPLHLSAFTSLHSIPLPASTRHPL